MNPKIYAYCTAGCRWETVHKSDFVKAVQYVEIPIPTDTETVDLEVGNKYKIYSDKITARVTVWKSYPNVYIGRISKTFLTGGDDVDLYRDYYYIEILAAEYKADSSTSTLGTLTITYEFNGVRKTVTISDVIIGSAYSININGATKIYLYNKDAVELIGENGEDGADGKDGADGADGADGKSAYEIAVENGYTGTEGQFGAALVKAAGSTGWTDEQITLLETILANIAYTDESTGQTAADSLISSLRGGATSDKITQSGSVLTISALKNAPEQMGSSLYIN